MCLQFLKTVNAHRATFSYEPPSTGQKQASDRASFRNEHPHLPLSYVATEHKIMEQTPFQPMMTTVNAQTCTERQKSFSHCRNVWSASVSHPSVYFSPVYSGEASPRFTRVWLPSLSRGLFLILFLLWHGLTLFSLRLRHDDLLMSPL